MARPTADLAELIRTACLMEATVPKPGNVHPAASFDNLCHRDFVTAAEVVAPILARATSCNIGQTILDAVRATHQATASNVNLGIVLLIAPLAAVADDVSLNDGIAHVLTRLDRDDAALVYEAIRLANPGGLGKSDTEDVADEPTGTLLEVMRLAAHRDAIARQYATNYELVLKTGVPLLAQFSDKFEQIWSQAIIQLHLTLMATHPDSLIARKLGESAARDAAQFAQSVLDAGWPSTRDGQEKLVELDGWLRADGNARNPGATADLVAAAIFAALRDGRVPLPVELK
jgi:triphosphoribosyl-dephospho-CoA synthase